MKIKWTQEIQSENIYPNLIALSALVEKKDAKIRVDVSCFSVQRERGKKNWAQVSMTNAALSFF
jgi:hypothetical protein